MEGRKYSISRPMETIRGKAIRTKLLKRGTKFYCIDLLTDSRSVSVVGSITQPVRAGDRIECIGNWETHPEYGEQFKARSISHTIAVTTDEAKSFLSSSMFPGIGPKSAERIALLYGECPDIIDAILSDPDRMKGQLRGVKDPTIDGMVSVLREYTGSYKLHAQLVHIGLNEKDVTDIMGRFGDKYDALAEDPYCVMNMGIPWSKADRIAHSFGIKGDSECRLRAGIVSAAMDKCVSRGDCALAPNILQAAAKCFLDVDTEVLEAAIQRLIESGHLNVEEIADGPIVYPNRMWMAESDAAQHLARISRGDRSVVPNPVIHIPEPAMTLSDEQMAAILAAIKNKVTVITGPPGSGKTTVIGLIAQTFRAAGVEIALCAPTGRAARQMTRDLPDKEIGSKTIHQLLCWGGDYRFAHHERNRLAARAIIIDEASMIDARLFAALVCAIHDEATVVIVGDASQLPSIGPGKVFAELISSGVIPVARLKTIQRQGPGSAITQNAILVDEGKMVQHSANFAGEFVTAFSRECTADAQDVIADQAHMSAYTIDARRDVQILTPRNGGLFGTHELNRKIQGKSVAAASKSGVALAYFRHEEDKYYVGDKVIQMVNDHNHGVVNGDRGFIVEATGRDFLVEFDSGIRATYCSANINDIRLAYAITIHKSQGSEFPIVIAIITREHERMFMRKLLYTAITRGKKKVILVGEEAAIQATISNTAPDRRITGLARRLREQFAT